MKKIAIVLLILTMGIWCMENREKVGMRYDRAATSVKRFLWGTKALPQETVVETDQAEPAPEEPVVEISAPVPVLTRLSAMLTEPELPPDTYFTKERISTMSDQGIKAIPGGVAVQKTGEQDGKFIVKDEQVEILVEPHRLTRDPGEIAVLKHQAAELQNSRTPPAVGATSTKKKTPALISSERAQIEGTIMGLDRKISELRSLVAQKKQADYEERRRGRFSRHAEDIVPLQSQILDLLKQRAYYANLLRKSR